jgi:hypothetical protein
MMEPMTDEGRDAAAWVDPDDAPFWTDETFARAKVIYPEPRMTDTLDLDGLEARVAELERLLVKATGEVFRLQEAKDKADDAFCDEHFAHQEAEADAARVREALESVVDRLTQTGSVNAQRANALHVARAALTQRGA